MKWKLNLPYLTEAERGRFIEMVENGDLTFFQQASCEHCGGDVPIVKDEQGVQIKLYCSVACFEESEEHDEQEGQDEQDDFWELD